jgi:two-component system, NtrC family, sensor kinase
VVVVDDEPMVLAAVARDLADYHDTETVGSGAVLMDRLRLGERFDAILCDVMMPDMTGMAVYEEVRRLEPRQAERMVFMSGGAFTAEAQQFARAMSHRLVEKPYQVHHLVSVIAEVSLGTSTRPPAAGAGDQRRAAR